jgi:hypothetical protein
MPLRIFKRPSSLICANPTRRRSSGPATGFTFELCGPNERAERCKRLIQELHAVANEGPPETNSSNSSFILTGCGVYLRSGKGNNSK